MFKSKTIIWLHILFWVLSLFDSVYISNFFAQRGIQTDYSGNPLGISSLAFKLISDIPTVLLHAAFFYLNLLVLLPHYFRRKQYIRYVLVVILVLAVGYLPLRYGIEDYYYKWIGGTGLDYTSKLFWISDSVTYAMRLGFLATAYYLTWQWVMGEKEKEQLRAEQLHTELSFLKNQTSPHFLFNTLGTLHALAHKGSAQTADAIVRLSDMLRYMLYNGEKEMVPLAAELDYIQNYLALQEPRAEQPMQVELKIALNEAELQSISIPPLLFIPFIENACKHGITRDSRYPVQIALYQTGQELHLRVQNRVARQEKDTQGGIGLANTRRRLELLYPGKHRFSIEQEAENGIFLVHITLITA